VFRWNAATEALDAVAIDGDDDDDDDDRVRDGRRMAAAARRFELDAALALYPLEDGGGWASLVAGCDLATARRVSGLLAVTAAADGGGTARECVVHIPGASPGSTAAQRTAYGVDTSAALAGVVADATTRLAIPRPQLGAVLVAELRAAYVLFVMAQCLPALEHWKRLVDCVCRAEAALASFSGAAPLTEGEVAALLAAVCSQLHHLPADFFTDTLSKDNFLFPALTAISASTAAAATAAPPTASPLAAVLADLRAVLASRFGTHLPPAAPARPPVAASEEFASMDALLAALRAAGGDDDLPAIVELP